MTGAKTPPGIDGEMPNDAAAAIDEKQAREEHWRRAGRLRVEESDPPRGSEMPGEGESRPPSPKE